MNKELQKPINGIPDFNHAWKFEITVESNDGTSQTIPNQALSMREIMERFARGIPLDAKLYDQYSDIENDEELMDTIDTGRLDYAEIEQLRKTVNSIISTEKSKQLKPVDKPEVDKPITTTTITNKQTENP